MNIGIISDTHDDLSSLKNAIKSFNERRADYVIHAWDYVFLGVVKQFKNFNGKLVGVLGNNDGEKLGLLRNFQEIGGELYGEFGDLRLDDWELRYIMGQMTRLLKP